MQIRKAVPQDAVRACDVIRRSIIELCQADHSDDPAILGKWLANKTPDNVRTWIAAPDGHFFVATDGDAILGVAAIRSSGEITLNYVAPAVRFHGVSKALLERLETTAATLGADRCVLTSTATARRFYLAAGYQDLGPPMSGFATSASRRMEKRLAGQPARATLA
jgi:GNAT superfamily N-acetyltransferase